MRSCTPFIVVVVMVSDLIPLASTSSTVRAIAAIFSLFRVPILAKGVCNDPEEALPLTAKVVVSSDCDAKVVVVRLWDVKADIRAFVASTSLAVTLSLLIVAALILFTLIESTLAAFISIAPVTVNVLISTVSFSISK